MYPFLEIGILIIRCNRIYVLWGMSMVKKVLPLIIGSAIGVFVGVICDFILSLVDYFAPQYSNLARAIFNISMVQ